LAALLSADVVGYSRLMAEDELATIRTLAICREKIRALVGENSGRIVNFVGDNVLVEFPSALDAVSCAIKLQNSLGHLNAGLPENRHMQFRIGINLGDILVDGDVIYGDGVNIAARLEALAEPGGICVSEMVYSQIHHKLDVNCVDMGAKTLKNIPDPVRVYGVFEPSTTSAAHKVESISRQATPLPLPAKPSLAVLPFVNLSNDPGQDYFSDGLTLDIMTALVRIPDLFLISDISMFSFKLKPVSIKDIGRQLGVSHVLEGGVRKGGEKLRVTARLVETTSGRQVWADRYDATLDDIFAIQDQIAEEIVTAMDVKLVSGEVARTIRKSIRNPDALEAYYRGWQALFGTEQADIFESQKHFEDTMRLEPESPIGYALAAWTHWWAIFRGLSKDTAQSLEYATDLARKAVDLEDITGLPHLMMALIHLQKSEHDKALTEAEQAVLARPSCDLSYAAKGYILNYLGRPAEAIELANYAIRLAPVQPLPFYQVVLAAASYSSGKFEEAIAAAKEALRYDKENLDALLILAGANAALNHMEDAAKITAEIRQVQPDFTLEKFASNQPYKNPETLEQLLISLRKAGLQ
ncbi:MAG: adenylate/guanylate cyclase domain-containing protein, partial [Anaerolineales bacterium]